MGKFLEFAKLFLDSAKFTFYCDLARYPGIHMGIAAFSANDAIQSLWGTEEKTGFERGIDEAAYYMDSRFGITSNFIAGFRSIPLSKAH